LKLISGNIKISGFNKERLANMVSLFCLAYKQSVLGNFDKQIKADMVLSHISNQEITPGEEISILDLRPGIYGFVKQNYPGITDNSFISLTELNAIRRRYLTSLLKEEHGELADLDQEVLSAIQTNSILSQIKMDDDESSYTFGERLADKIAEFGGSWRFIILFFVLLLFWIFINLWLLNSKPFDPYPFILLNLILSCIAAIQAPVIMMSQNRQEAKDRLRSINDYKINLKAELEIKLLSEKIDHLIIHQNKKLLEIQEVQTDYLEDLLKELKKN
jgi:uncharacterized membrane protein